MSPQRPVAPRNDVPVATRAPLVMAVRGELDVATGDDLRTALHAIPKHQDRVLVDLRTLSFIDVAGLRTLGQSCVVLRERGVQVSVVPSRGLQRLLDVLDEAGAPVALPVASLGEHPRVPDVILTLRSNGSSSSSGGDDRKGDADPAAS